MAHVLTNMKVFPQTQNREAVELARELGLEVQAARYAKPLAGNAFEPLSDDEITLWRHHCPTRYTPGGSANSRVLEKYAFDTVPVEVLRHWKAVKDACAFDSYEIWTVQAAQADPILIGVLGERLFMLARWGLESPEQLPLREIAQRVYDRTHARAMEYFPDSPFQSQKKRMEMMERYLYLFHLGEFDAAKRILGM